MVIRNRWNNLHNLFTTLNKYNIDTLYGDQIEWCLINFKKANVTQMKNYKIILSNKFKIDNFVFLFGMYVLVVKSK